MTKCVKCLGELLGTEETWKILVDGLRVVVLEKQKCVKKIVNNSTRNIINIKLVQLYTLVSRQFYSTQEENTLGVIV